MDIFASGAWLPVLQVVAVDLLLGADNAMVVALACRNLPPGVRNRGILWGAAAVIAVRSTLTAGVALLLQVPYLRLAGGVLLLAVAVRLVRLRPGQGAPDVAARSGLAGAVATIVAADAVMSVDNVLAVAAAAEGRVAPVVLGLAVSIPVMIFFSRAILALVGRYPAVVSLGGALVGWIALRTALADPAVGARLGAGDSWAHLALPAAAALAVAALGVIARRR